MSEKEICRSYLNAQSRSLQVGILADLNECSSTDILRILITNGLNVTEASPKRSRGTEKDKVAKLIMKMLDETDEEVKAAEKKYKRIAKVLMSYGEVGK